MTMNPNQRGLLIAIPIILLGIAWQFIIYIPKKLWGWAATYFPCVHYYEDTEEECSTQKP